MNPDIFRAYDIRGHADRDLPDDDVFAIGYAFASLICARGLLDRVAIGRDARLSSPRIRDALSDGLRAGGCDVLDVGLVPTPVVYFAAFTREVGGAVMVTGSHNPGDENGLKMVIDKSAIFGDDIVAIAALAKTVVRADASANLRASNAPIARSIEVLRPYCDQLALLAELGPRRPKIVIDAGNGPTGFIVPGLLERLGFEVFPLFCELDGTFPNHHPDPTVPENLLDLQRKVLEVGADLGVAYDGDGDRMGVVDEKAQIVWGDRLLAILARALLAEVPGAAIVAEVKCSDVLFDDIKAHGGRAIMGQVGHSLIKARMKAEGALLAGEMSGHIFYAHRYFGFDDAIHATIRLLELLSNEPRPLSALLADLPTTYATPELRLPCADRIKFDVVAAVRSKLARDYEVIDIDGVRVRFGDGWGLVRASNTGPVLVMRCEAMTQPDCDAIEARLRADVDEAVAAIGAQRRAVGLEVA
jgi:phosphomannomutase / phosphoglucomutase